MAAQRVFTALASPTFFFFFASRVSLTMYTHTHASRKEMALYRAEQNRHVAIASNDENEQSLFSRERPPPLVSACVENRHDGYSRLRPQRKATSIQISFSFITQ